MIGAIQYGLGQLWRYKKVWAILYVVTLLMAVLVAYPFKSYLEKTLGNSMMISDMLKGFDYTLYIDFVNNYGDLFGTFMNQSFWVILLFLILFIFFNGGMVRLFLDRTEAYDSRLFWSNCAAFFWKFFRNSIYFLIIHGIIFILFLMIYSYLCKGFSISELDSEGIIFAAPKYLAPIYILVSSFFFMWQDYTKISLVRNHYKWVYQGMFDSIRFIRRNLISAWGLYLLNMLLLALIFTINYFITTAFEIQSFQTVVLSFLFAQLFTIARLGMKMVNLSSAAYWYTSKTDSDESTAEY